LNSSLALSAAELWLAKVWHERANYAFSEKLGIRLKTRYLAHNFSHRCGSKSIKGSIDADCHLVFNKPLSQKNGQWVGAQGGPKVAYFSKTCPLSDVTFRKQPTKNKNCFFFILTTRLAESVEGLNSSLAQSPGEL